MSAIGIDLGEDSVKIVELVQSKKSIHVQSLYEKKLSPLSSPHDKEIEIIEFLRGIFSEKKHLQHQFIIAIRQDKATVRRKIFPFSDRIKIQKSLSFEMEEDIPFDPDNCLFDYKTVRTIGASSETLSIAIPKTHIEKIINLAKDCGVELKIITLEGFAFSNLIEDWNESPPTSVDQLVQLNSEERVAPSKAADIFLDIGHKKTLLCARIDNRVIFTRSLMWGGDMVIQEIIKRFQLPYSEAQRTLHKSTLHLSKKNLTLEEQNLTTLIEKSIRDMVRDVQMSFLEIESELGAYVTELNFTGGFSQLPNLGAYLTQQLEVPCNAVNLVEGYLPSQLNTNLDHGKIISQFPVAIGIALEAFKKPKNPALQFLKGEFANQNNFLTTFWSHWGQLVQVGAAGLLVLFLWSYFRESFSFDLNEKGSEVLSQQAKTLIKLPKKMANEKGVKKYISQHKKYQQEMKTISQVSTMASALDILKNISESAPNKQQTQIDVVQLSINDDTVKLSGYAHSPREVSLLSTQLMNLSANKKITEEPSTLGVLPQKVAFSFSFKTTRGVEKPEKTDRTAL